jgi:hypothetical protein
MRKLLNPLSDSPASDLPTSDVIDDVIDDEFSAIVQAALQDRVDQVIDSPILTPSAAAFARLARTAKTRKRVTVAVGAMAASAIGFTGATQLAGNKPKITKTKTITATAAFPKLILPSPEYQIVSFREYRDSERSLAEQVNSRNIHVRKSETEWFDVYGPTFAFPDVTEDQDVVQVGNVEAALTTNGESWTLQWNVGDYGAFATGTNSMPTKEVAVALGGVSLVTPAGQTRQTISLNGLPAGYTVNVDETEREGAGYRSTYLKTKSGSGVPLHLSVEQPSGYELDYWADRRIVKSNARTYHVREDGKENTVSWIEDGWRISLYGKFPIDQVLEAAEKLRTAQPVEWIGNDVFTNEYIEPRDTERKQPAAVLVYGTTNSLAWELRSQLARDSDSCRTVTFAVEQKTISECIPRASSKVLLMQRAVAIGDTPLVFGVASDKSEEAQVITIDDASGNRLREDISVTDASIDGRTFAIELPQGAQGPFTVSVYAFDGEWYNDTFDTREEETYVKPGSEPLEKATVNIESPA